MSLLARMAIFDTLGRRKADVAAHPWLENMFEGDNKVLLGFRSNRFFARECHRMAVANVKVSKGEPARSANLTSTRPSWSVNLPTSDPGPCCEDGAASSILSQPRRMVIQEEMKAERRLITPGIGQ